MTPYLLPLKAALVFVLTTPFVVAAQTLVPAVTFMTSADTSGEEWPADFNGDGKTDLVSMTGTGELQVRIGTGNGTFRTPIVSATRAVPLATGDLNGDRRVDVVAREHRLNALLVLPGNGDGTLGEPVPIPEPMDFDFALVADLDNDGWRDIVTAWRPDPDGRIHIYRGGANFTFSPPVGIETNVDGMLNGFVIDVNADGLRDIVTVHPEAMRLLLNGGGMTFTARNLPRGSGYTTDVTARDITGDGHVDLLISGRFPGHDELTFERGYVFAAVGHGDGTFTPGGEFPTGRGANSIVYGDFTHDGIVDVATANHSNWRHTSFSVCGLMYQGSYSVSILPGRGDGTFGLPTSFALNRPVADDSLFREAGHGTLNTSDVNRDHFPDLITGGGLVLVTTKPKPNRRPIVSAGADRPFLAPDTLVHGDAFDPDGHFLSFAWTSPAGYFDIDDAPIACYWREDETGPRELTLTVSDGHEDGVASDTVVLDALPDEAPRTDLALTLTGLPIREAVPYTIRWEAYDPSITAFEISYAAAPGHVAIAECQNLPATVRECTWISPGPATSGSGVLLLRGSRDSGPAVTWAFVSVLPANRTGWESRDIGAVAAPGGTTFHPNQYRIRGSGADIWGTADEFHFAFRTITGDFDVSVRVGFLDKVHPWTKAGLMVRAGAGARAAHASLFLTAANGLSFQTRPARGQSSVERGHVDTSSTIAWLRLVRNGTTVRALYRDLSTEQWMPLSETSVELGDSVLVGLAVTSHADGILAGAEFGDFEVAVGGLPPGVRHQSIGDVQAAGSATWDGTTFVVRGSGADIWGRRDEFDYVSAAVTGDFTIIARVTGVESIHQWSKAGLMIREGDSAAARHASVFLTPTSANGVAFQRRTSVGAPTVHTAGPALTAPLWIRLVRSGDAITAGWRTSPSFEWIPIGTETLTGLADTVSIGLAVTSHVDGELATATFEEVNVTQQPQP